VGISLIFLSIFITVLSFFVALSDGVYIYTNKGVISGELASIGIKDDKVVIIEV
jgi:hypothetical protein